MEKTTTPRETTTPEERDLNRKRMLFSRFKRQQRFDSVRFNTKAMFCSQSEKSRRRRERLCVYCARPLTDNDIVLCSRCHFEKKGKTMMFYSDSSASESEAPPAKKNKQTETK